MAAAPATVLTLDLGTSATKGALWRGAELRAMTRAPIATSHPQPGWAEQDADDWWASVTRTCTQLRAAAPSDLASVDAVGFSAARETFALYDDTLQPLTPGILWSDRRATAEAADLGDPVEFRATTGVVLDGGAHAAKLAWMARHRPDRLQAARWILQPRDAVVARMTGVVVTDETLASRTGLCALDDGWLPDALSTYGERLPEMVAPTAIVGEVTSAAARELGVPVGRRVSVVVGAGDRACEVLGSAASARTPMVSWGTTANVSVPHPGPLSELPTVASVSRGAVDGFVVEAGLSAAGAAIDWLASLTGREPHDLLADAAEVAPGAAGVVALPWLAGARAPWWRADAHAAFTGLSLVHGPAELTRAVIEGIAFDVVRSLELIAPARGEVVVAGGGAAAAWWRPVLAAVSELPLVRRSHDDAASVGARLVVARALGERLDVDDVNPLQGRELPDRSLVEAYRSRRPASDAAAAAALRTDDGF